MYNICVKKKKEWNENKFKFSLRMGHPTGSPMLLLLTSTPIHSGNPLTPMRGALAAAAAAAAAIEDDDDD